jgi:serine protease
MKSPIVRFVIMGFSLLLILLLFRACRSREFSWVVDPSVKPPSTTSSAQDNVSVEYVRDLKGITYTFASDLVVVRPKSPAELSVLLQKYNGAILFNGKSELHADPHKMAPPEGTYLIRVDPSRSQTDDLSSTVKRAKLIGNFKFSSLNGVRLVALVAREAMAGTELGLDPALHLQEVWNTVEVMEGQLPDGSTLNYANEPYATTVLKLGQPTGQLGIGVVRAWDYLEYKGIPFGPTWRVPTIAFIDGGFALDTTTGAPLNGNSDFRMGRTPVQLSESANGSGLNAGGTNPSSCSGGPCPWHGTGVFSTAAAYPGNNFGAAGSGGMIPETVFIKIDVSDGFEAARAISDAVRLEPAADVINLSFGVGRCGSFCGYFYNTVFGSISDSVNFARGYNQAIVVAAAGNDSESDNSELDNVPCTLDGVLCVGAIDTNAKRRNYGNNSLSGAGTRVAIWAPDCEWVTPTPDSNGQLKAFCGTSASSPFVAGIVSLMKALNPNLSYDDVKQILQTTALQSPDPVVTPGYVNALAAVMAVRPNLPPTIVITEPQPASKFAYGSPPTFGSHVSDPEQPGGVVGLTITWTSSIDGQLCTGIVCDSKLLSPGAHKIVATIVDPFGASGSASIQLTVAPPTPPVATIIYPPNGAAFSSSQQVQLIGAGAGATQPTLPDSKLAWSSSLAGPLAFGGDIWVNLPEGTQTITLTATDISGQTASASTQIVIQSGPRQPTVKILKPAYSSALGVGAIGDFVGIGTDPLDGPLVGSSLKWTSDIDGFLGDGTEIHTKLSSGVCGPTGHQITLTGTNSIGQKAESTVIVAVGPIC